MTKPISIQPLSDRVHARARTNRTKTRIFLLLFLGAVLFGIISVPPSHAVAGFQVAQVHQVHDGDTVTLRLKGKKFKTRLIGIDAPEMGQRPWGRKAKEHLIQIMRRTKWTVYIETDEERTDKYGRALAYLWTSKHVLVNERMIVDGYAVAFPIPPNMKYSERFTNAENSAHEKGKAIWSANGLKESPVEWRKKHPRKNRPHEMEGK